MIKVESELADVCVALYLDFLSRVRGEAMLKIFIILILGLAISITLNLALLCILYIQWVNKQID